MLNLKTLFCAITFSVFAPLEFPQDLYVNNGLSREVEKLSYIKFQFNTFHPRRKSSTFSCETATLPSSLSFKFNLDLVRQICAETVVDMNPVFQSIGCENLNDFLVQKMILESEKKYLTNHSGYAWLNDAENKTCRENVDVQLALFNKIEANPDYDFNEEYQTNRQFVFNCKFGHIPLDFSNLFEQAMDDLSPLRELERCGTYWRNCFLGNNREISSNYKDVYGNRYNDNGMPKNDSASHERFEKITNQLFFDLENFHKTFETNSDRYFRVESLSEYFNRIKEIIQKLQFSFWTCSDDYRNYALQIKFKEKEVFSAQTILQNQEKEREQIYSVFCKELASIE